MKNRNDTILKSSAIIIVLVIIFKVLGFIKQAVIAAYFGASASTDVYFIAYGFSVGVSEAIVKAISLILISLYTKIRIQKGKDEADKLISGIFELLIPLSIIIILLICTFAPQISKLLAPSLAPELYTMLISFIRILSVAFLFISIELICTSVLESHKKFIATKLQSFIYSVIVILACIYASKYVGINTLIIAHYVSNIIFITILVIMVKKYFKFIFVNPFKNNNIKELSIKIVPLIIGNSIIQINQMVDKAIASGLGEGYTSALAYSQVLEQFVTNILIVNIGNIMLSYFSSYIAENNLEKVKKLLINILNILVCLLIPITCITILFSEDIVKLIYFRGDFSLKAVELTSLALSGYAISFTFMAIRDILNKSIYSFGDTKLPMRNSIISIITNIVTSIILAKRIGIIGIAIGTSIGVAAGATLNMVTIKRFILNFSFKNLYITVLKNLPPLLFISITILFIKNKIYLDGNYILIGVISTIVLVIYCIILYIENVSEIRNIINKLLCKLKTIF